MLEAVAPNYWRDVRANTGRNRWKLLGASTTSLDLVVFLIAISDGTWGYWRYCCRYTGGWALWPGSKARNAHDLLRICLGLIDITAYVLDKDDLPDNLSHNADSATPSRISKSMTPIECTYSALLSTRIPTFEVLHEAVLLVLRY